MCGLRRMLMLGMILPTTIDRRGGAAKERAFGLPDMELRAEGRPPACSSGSARAFGVGLGLVAGGQELIVQAIDLVGLVRREFMPASQVAPVGLAVEPILNRPVPVMGRGALRGHAALSKEGERPDQREGEEGFVRHRRAPRSGQRRCYKRLKKRGFKRRTTYMLPRNICLVVSNRSPRYLHKSAPSGASGLRVRPTASDPDDLLEPPSG